jgi:hypothetical protein
LSRHAGFGANRNQSPEKKLSTDFYHRLLGILEHQSVKSVAKSVVSPRSQLSILYSPISFYGKTVDLRQSLWHNHAHKPTPTGDDGNE